MKYPDKKHYADIVIFSGMLMNVAFIALILYYFVL
jgi:hypothetical protein